MTINGSYVFLSLALAGVLAGPALAGPPAPATLGQQQTPDDKDRDTEFVKQVAELGQKEIDAGKIATTEASVEEVQAFAVRLAADHTTIHGELLSLAGTPPAPAKPEAGDGATPAWASASGQEFDRAYLAQTIDSHRTLVAIFEREAADGNDERLKLWAGQKVPMLREHLEMARGLALKVASE